MKGVFIQLKTNTNTVCSEHFNQLLYLKVIGKGSRLLSMTIQYLQIAVRKFYARSWRSLEMLSVKMCGDPGVCNKDKGNEM